MELARNGKPESLKRRNRELLMSILASEPALSRAALARLSGLSRTTVSHLVDELLTLNFLTELDAASEGPGRPATPLAIDRTSWHALGVELRTRQWVIVAVNLLGEVSARAEVPLSDVDPPAAGSELVRGLRAFINRTRLRFLPLVGIGLPGLINADSGAIMRAVDGAWTEFRSLERRLSLDLGFDSVVINRHRAAGLAETRFGAGKNTPDLIYLGIGNGIAGGIFWRGELVRGASGSSGEFGHVTVLPDGPLCICGNRGCLQTLASGAAMVSEARKLIQAGRPSRLAERAGGELSGEDVCRAAAEGDAVALECLARAVQYLAIAVANLIAEYNPSAVVLGGPVGEIAEPLIPMLRAEVKRRAMAHPLSAVRIVPASLGRDAGAIGAASLVLDRKFDLVFPDYRA